MKVYVNGNIVDHDKAVISVFDRGFLYGDAIFETMRSYGGRIFRVKEHLGRLYSAMRFLKIKQPISDKEAERAAYELLEISGLIPDGKSLREGAPRAPQDARIRITISRGESEDSKMDISKSGPSTIVMTAEQYAPPDKYYENGIAVNIAESRRNSRTVLKNFKVVNYLDSILARNEALSKGCFDTIFRNDAGYVCEGSTSNIFMVSGNKLLTPSLDCGVLPGITRKIILEISRCVGLGMQEGKFILDDLKNSSEVFITNSLFEIMPVVKVEDKAIGNGRVGEVTKKIHRLYKQLVEEYTKSAGNGPKD